MLHCKGPDKCIQGSQGWQGESLTWAGFAGEHRVTATAERQRGAVLQHKKGAELQDAPTPSLQRAFSEQKELI